MKSALVTGANGFIGSQLCRELIAHGVRVRALRRPNSNMSFLEGVPVDSALGDVTDIESLRSAMDGVDTVFHIAALYREAKYEDSMYWRVNYEGTKNAIEAAIEKGVSYFCHCSTTGVLGDIEDPPADETYRYCPLDVYQESKTEAEKLVLQYFEENRIRGSVIRPAMVWGPYDTRLLKLFRGIAKRRFPLIGDGQTWCHWILVEDLVRAFRLAALTPESNGQLYIIAGDRPVTLKYTMETIARAFEVSLLPIKIPIWPFQLVGGILETLCAPFGIEPPLHRRRADFFIKNRSFRTDKSHRDLHFVPTYSFEEEVSYIVHWYREHGWI